MGEVPAEALGRNLVSGGCDLSGLSNDKPPARNAFAGAARIIHHVESEHRFFCRHPKIYVLRRNRRDLILRSLLTRIPLDLLFEDHEDATICAPEMSTPPQARPRRSRHPQSESLLQRYPGSQLPKWKIPPAEWPTVVARIEQNHEPLRQVARDYGVSYEAIRRVLKAARHLKL